MRIGFRKKIGGVYVSSSTSTKGLGKGILSIFMLPFYLMYYVCIWPFVAIYRLVTRKAKKEKEDAAVMAPQYLRIVNDCSKIVGETKNPEVFFQRYDLLLDTLAKLSSIEHIAPLNGSKPSDEMDRISSLREEATDAFIDRYAQEIRMKIYELSTEKAKQNKIDMFRNTLNEYSDKLTERNMTNIENHCRKMQEFVK